MRERESRGRDGLVPLPFDQVFLKEEDSEREISLSEFQSIRLNDRVRLLLEERIRFQLGDAEVKTAVALKSLAADKRAR